MLKEYLPAAHQAHNQISAPAFQAPSVQAAHTPVPARSTPPAHIPKPVLSPLQESSLLQALTQPLLSCHLQNHQSQNHLHLLKAHP